MESTFKMKSNSMNMNVFTLEDNGQKYGNFDYSPDVIQSVLKNYSYYKTNADKIMNTNIISIYLDLDNAIAKTNLTERQQLALRYYSRGFTIDQIGERMNISHQAVSKLVSKLCKQISKTLQN